MSNQAIEKTNGNGGAKSLTLKAFLESPAAKGKLAEAAGKYMKPDDLVRLALMAASRQPEIAKCSHTSILRALMDASALGIAPGGTMGRGYLVPRMNKKNGELEAVFDPGWRGLIDIARRTGKIKRIEAHVVYEVDRFDVELGLTPKIVHLPTLDAEDRGAIVAAYAIAEFLDGATQFEVLTKADIEKVKNTSAAKGGPWSSWYDEMARKTAVRRLCKYLPFFDPVMERALEHATEVEAGERIVVDTTFVEDKKPRAKQLAASIAAKTAAAQAETEPPPEEAPEPVVTADGEVQERQPGED